MEHFPKEFSEEFWEKLSKKFQDKFLGEVSDAIPEQLTENIGDKFPEEIPIEISVAFVGGIPWQILRIDIPRISGTNLRFTKEILRAIPKEIPGRVLKPTSERFPRGISEVISWGFPGEGRQECRKEFLRNFLEKVIENFLEELPEEFPRESQEISKKNGKKLSKKLSFLGKIPWRFLIGTTNVISNWKSQTTFLRI